MHALVLALLFATAIQVAEPVWLDAPPSMPRGTKMADVNPPGEPHFLVVEEESVLQLTCEGPWELAYVTE